jgi:hypothetical protein
MASNIFYMIHMTHICWHNRIIKYALNDSISSHCIQWRKSRNHSQEVHLLKKVLWNRVNLTLNIFILPTIYLLYTPNIHFWGSFNFKHYYRRRNKGEMNCRIPWGLCSGKMIMKTITIIMAKQTHLEMISASWQSCCCINPSPWRCPWLIGLLIMNKIWQKQWMSFLILSYKKMMASISGLSLVLLCHNKKT